MRVVAGIVLYNPNEETLLKSINELKENVNHIILVDNNSDNIYYIETEDGLTGIKKYEYIIKENYFNPGVFYIHIPLEKIPSNFFIPSTDEILSIAEKAKPYGMKPLIRYISTIKFKHNFRFKTNSIIKESIPIYMGEIDKIRYTGIPYQYHNIYFLQL